MHYLVRDSRTVGSIVLGLVCVAAVTVGAQVRKPAAATPSSTTTKPAVIARASDGHPDLDGIWDFAQLTPFERPGNYAGKSSFTDNEAEEFAQQRLETGNKDRRDGGAAADVERAYNDFWWDFGTRVSKQTSLVVDPPDGRVPPRTPDAEQRATRKPSYENPEERPLPERCILGFNSGPPMVPSAYNNNVQLVQTHDYLTIVNEMIHSARIVDLTGRPHAPKAIRYLTGDSIGHWEGDTLVVDTTNFLKDGAFRGASANMHLIERFSREDGNTLRYEFTVDDPATWTKKWTASIPMVRTNERMFEYSCHEANYALEGVLKGARFQEQQTPPSQK
jgi:hypothetical protein